VPEAVEDTVEATTFPDERLELVFTCCHPALAPDAQVALTLREVCDLKTEEIAHAFLVPESTMAQRISRAKQRLKTVDAPFALPPPAELAQRLIAKASGRLGTALVRPLLLVQFLLLTCVLIFRVMSGSAAKPHGLVAGVIAMIAVSAMACQFALLRLGVPGAPSTAVMTGNLTNTVLSLLDTLSGSEPLMQGSKERLRKTAELVAGFFFGCLAGAMAVSWLGDWAWLLPVTFAGVAVVLR